MCRSFPYLFLESAKNILPLSRSKGTGRSILYLAFHGGGSSIYSELNGFQNVQDIYNEELINAVRLRSLALFLRYKLELGDGRRNGLRVQMSSEAKMKEPSEAPPHHLGSGVFVFKRGKIVHQSSYQEMIVKLLEAEHCYSDIPVHPVKKYKFLFIANRMLIISSAKEPFHKLYMVSKMVQNRPGAQVNPSAAVKDQECSESHSP